MTHTICVLLWAREGRKADLAAYEDQALALLGEHGGRSLQRLVGRRPGDPDEVHVLQFPSEHAFQAYLADPRRGALDHLRAAAVDRAQVIEVDPSP